MGGLDSPGQAGPSGGLPMICLPELTGTFILPYDFFEIDFCTASVLEWSPIVCYLETLCVFR